MSVDQRDVTQAPGREAASSWARAESRLTTHIEDLFLSDEDRLDDRTRAAVSARLRATVRAVAHDLAQRVADRMPGHAVDAHGAMRSLAEPPEFAAAAVLHRLHASGLLQDRALMEELFAQVRQDMLSDGLRDLRVPGTDAALLGSLVAGSDPAIAEAASAYAQAEARRRSDGRTDLPPDRYQALLWWAAAALRAQAAVDPVRQRASDQAIAEAAQQLLRAGGDAARLEASADRLAAALDSGPAELGDRLVAALEEGCVALFVALLARALALDAVEVRALVLDPEGEGLWHALRAVDLDRPAIARIGFLLAEADSRRDLEAFADKLDALVALPVREAAEALAVLALPRPFRAAMRALDRAVAR